MEEISSRRRVNLSQTSKGINFDITVEIYNKENEDVVREVLDLKDKLQVALNQKI